MSDNKINFGVEFGGEGFQKAAKMLDSSIKGLDGSAKGVEKSFSSAFGDATIRSLTAITAKFEKLSSLIQKISSQSYGLSQAMGGIGGPGSLGGGPGGAPSQVPIYDANGNVIKTVSTTPSGGGMGGGGSGPNGGNSPTPPPPQRMDAVNTYFSGQLFSQGVGGIKQAFDFFRPYGGLDLQQYQRSQYGLSESLHGDISKRLIDQSFGGPNNVSGADKLSALGSSLMLGIPTGFATGFATGNPFLGGLVGATVGASAYNPALDRIRDQRYAQFQNLSKSLVYGQQFVSDMSNAEKLYGAKGIDSAVLGSAIYGDEAAKAELNKARKYGASAESLRRNGLSVGLMADQRFGLGSLSESSLFSGELLGKGTLDLTRGYMAKAGFTPGKDLAAIENISGMANQYSQQSGLGLRGDDLARLQGGFFQMAEPARKMGLSAMEQTQAVQTGQRYSNGLLGTTIGWNKAYSVLKSMGVSDTQAFNLMDAGVFGPNMGNVRKEFKQITGREIDLPAFKKGAGELLNLPFKLLNANTDLEKNNAARRLGHSGLAGQAGIQGQFNMLDALGTPGEEEAIRKFGRSVKPTAETRQQDLTRQSAKEVQGLISNLGLSMQEFRSVINKSADEFLAKITGEWKQLKQAQVASEQREKTLKTGTTPFFDIRSPTEKAADEVNKWR